MNDRLIYFRTLENNLGLLSELKKWKRKYEILENIIERLKSKECKSVISCLVAGRSKMLRKWKFVDSR